MTLGERIYAQRKRMGITQEELAERIGVSRQAVSRWEQDGAEPELAKLAALAAQFGVSSDMLLGLADDGAATVDAPGESQYIKSLRRIWYNIGYFLLIWGALVAGLTLCAALIWGGLGSVLLQAAFFIGLFAFAAGLALVLFRMRRPEGRERKDD